MRFRFSPLVVAVSLALSFSSQVTASPTDLETEEYKSSGALDIIKASQAYDLGYTGQGLTIGILDTAVRIDHPELAGKAEMLMNYAMVSACMGSLLMQRFGQAIFSMSTPLLI